MTLPLFVALTAMVAGFLFLFVCFGWVAHAYYHAVVGANATRANDAQPQPAPFSGTTPNQNSRIGSVSDTQNSAGTTAAFVPMTIDPTATGVPRTTLDEISDRDANRTRHVVDAPPRSSAPPAPLASAESPQALRRTLPTGTVETPQRDRSPAAVEVRLHSVLTVGGNTSRAHVATLSGYIASAESLVVTSLALNGEMWKDTALSVAQRLGFERDFQRAIARAPRADRLVLQYTRRFDAADQPELNASVTPGQNDVEWNERWIPKTRSSPVNIAIDDSVNPYRLIVRNANEQPGDGSDSPRALADKWK